MKSTRKTLGLILALFCIVLTLGSMQWMSSLTDPSSSSASESSSLSESSSVQDKSPLLAQGQGPLASLSLSSSISPLPSSQPTDATISWDPQQEYRLLYSLSPPPRFDKWAQFAQDKKCYTSLSKYSALFSDLAPYRDMSRDEFIKRLELLTKNSHRAVDVLEIKAGKVTRGPAYQVQSVRTLLF